MTFTNFIKRPVLSTVISIFFVLLGAIGLVSLPIEQYPDIAPPTISVMTSYTGADAQAGIECRYGGRQRAEPCPAGSGFAAG